MRTTKVFCRIISLLMVLVMFCGMLAACTKENGGEENTTVSQETTGKNEETTATDETNTEENTTAGEENTNPNEVKISITSDKSTISKSESATLTVVVENATDKTYTLSSSDDTLVKIEGNVVSVIGDIKTDKYVTITATSNEDNTKTATKTLIVKAPVIEGQVGELTSEMIQAIGNPSITITGILTDYYIDYKQSSNTSTNYYEMVVTMNEGAWMGKWNIKGVPESAVTDNYRKGDKDGIIDAYGNTGHELLKLYIDKNNKVGINTVKDYMSIPAVWEAQHLWNHLGNLDVTKFTYDLENDRYIYNVDNSNEDDAYLLTYLSYSLTPMLSDSLVGLYLVIENGQITKLVAETEKLLYGDDTNEDPDACSYTTIEVRFSDIGKTTVIDPEPYEAPEYVEYLEAALKKMSSTKNYTFRVKDVLTNSPSIDGGDYEIDSSNPLITTFAYGNNVSSVGTVGCVGFVTEEAAVFGKTIKYNYSMDGKDYKTEYTGYKDNGDGTYDEFAYGNGHFYGTKRVTGNFFDVMPKFDFSANIFEFVYATTKNGQTLYTFKLRETAITRDIALEVSSYTYAKDADASASQSFTITVDSNGNLISTVFPYDINYGTYMGNCTTTYTEVGTTVLDADAFDGYERRENKTTWDMYTVKYYYPTHSTLERPETDPTADVVFKAIYGEEAYNNDMPSPSIFMDVFGDNIFGPFFDWKEKGTDSDGNPIYADYVSVTTSSSNYDENSKITDYEELMEKLTNLLKAEGFEVSKANTDTSGGESGRSDRFITFIKGDVQIVVENNFTKNFWIYFYKTGDWTLNK